MEGTVEVEGKDGSEAGRKSGEGKEASSRFLERMTRVGTKHEAIQKAVQVGGQ